MYVYGQNNSQGNFCNVLPTCNQNRKNYVKALQIEKEGKFNQFERGKMIQRANKEIEVKGN